MLKTIRQQSIATLITVLVVLVAWLFVSNRCGLLLMAPHGAGVAEAHSCCHPQVPAQHTPAQHSLLCCKSLSATLALNTPVTFHPPIVTVDFAVRIETAAVLEEPAGTGWSTGPPGAPPLLSCVLVSSRQAHGPPASA